MVSRIRLNIRQLTRLSSLCCILLFNPLTALAQQVDLPIEVLGPDGHVQQVNFELSNASKARGLRLLANNLSFEGKASIKINSGSWTSLTNDAVTMSAKDQSYGGIGGAFATIEVTIPVQAGALEAGQNTILFRFNRMGSKSSGYRIVRMNVVDSSGKTLLPASTFKEDNPDTWSPPIATNAAYTEGERLWHEAALKPSPDASKTMRAVCADCHATDGRDLKYFNYSNKSIIARSEFHGLSETEAKQIASYIRNLNTPNPGRPWNPPYQPGPGLDSGPVEHWAAGAGIDAVLEKDADVVEYLFPNGISSETIATHQTTNMREIPLAIQLPDWKHWLPTVHPKDAWGNDFDKSDMKEFLDDLAVWVSQASRNEKIEAFPLKFSKWRGSLKDFMRDGRGFDQDPTESGAEDTYSTRLWFNVKMWELMQVGGMEDILRENDKYADHGEVRSWAGGRILFDTAPHINKIPNDERGIGGSPITNAYFSSIWYQLQVILDAGNRVRNQTSPVDWNYQFNHINAVKYGGLGEPMRLVLSLVKAMQMMDNEHGVEDAVRGWAVGYADFPRLAASKGNAGRFMETLPKTVRAKVSGAVIGAWLDKVSSIPIDEWPRNGLNENGAIGLYPAKGYVVKSNPSIGHTVDDLWDSLPGFSQMGVKHELLVDVADWASQMWPKNDWASQIGAGSLPIELASFDASATDGGITLNWETSSELNNRGFEVEHREVGVSGEFETIAFVEGAGTTSDPVQYAYTMRGLMVGRHAFRLRQIDTDGTSSLSPEVEVELGVPSVFSVTNPYPNPFRTRTRFSLALGQTQHVRIAVYNALGAVVDQIQNGPLEENRQYDFTYSPTALSRGVYFIQVAGTSFETSFPVVIH